MANITEKKGLASILHIYCDKCCTVNDVKTTQTHTAGTRSSLAFDNNTRAVLATLHTEIGESHLGKVLSTLNIPPLSRSTFKRRERETGKAAEKVARQSCHDATSTERLHALKNRSIEDTDGLVDITCSYDMGWQKRGRAFNSLTGHGAAMSVNSGKVLAFATRNKKCRACEHNKNKSKPPTVHHTCRLNYKGSSKYMETDVACQLFRDALQTKVKYSSYVGDDDSTTLAELVKQSPYELQKYSDIIHIKRSLGTRLYNLSQRMKFPNCSVLSPEMLFILY